MHPSPGAGPSTRDWVCLRVPVCMGGDRREKERRPQSPKISSEALLTNDTSRGWGSDTEKFASRREVRRNTSEDGAGRLPSTHPNLGDDGGSLAPPSRRGTRTRVRLCLPDGQSCGGVSVGYGIPKIAHRGSIRGLVSGPTTGSKRVSP